MKGKANEAYQTSGSRGSPEFTENLFGDPDGDSEPLVFRDFNAEALRHTIAGVLLVGGYISFSSQPGGRNVKLSCALGNVGGSAWCGSEQQLSAALLRVSKIVDAKSKR